MVSYEHCHFADRCGGCSLWDFPFEEHQQIKTNKVYEQLRGSNAEADPILRKKFQDHFPIPKWSSLGSPLRERQRIEVQIRNGKLGFLGKTSGFEFVEINDCLLAKKALAEYFSEVRKVLTEIKKGSMRLRISPNGLRGVWLDLPNEDVRPLLDEKVGIRPLLEISDVLEIGQKRKNVISDSVGRLKLNQGNEFKAWTRSWFEGSEVPLFSAVGDFTQPNDKSNKIICEVIQRYLVGSGCVFEFGSGNGNLTFAALSSVNGILSIEREMRLSSAFEKSLTNAKSNFKNLTDKNIRFSARWIKSSLESETKIDQNSALDFAYDALLLNPSREGVGIKFIESIPKQINKAVMMSCYSESFFKDVFHLFNAGFECEEWVLLDQFPMSAHIEIISKWTRNWR